MTVTDAADLQLRPFGDDPTVYQGHCRSVQAEYDGDETDTAAAAGAVTLSLDSVEDFYPGATIRVADGSGADGSGFLATVADTPTAVNPDTGTLTLTTGLAAAVDPGATVHVWSLQRATPVTTYWADVVVDGWDDDDPVEVLVPHSQAAYLREGISAGDGISVSFRRQPGHGETDYELVDIIGAQPSADARVLDPATYPDDLGGGDSGPTAPPASSPAVTVRGAIGGLAVSLGQVAVDTEAVDLWVSTSTPVDTSGAPTAAAPGVSGAVTFVRRVLGTVVGESGLPSTVEVPVRPDVTYYVVARARNEVGTAAASAEVSGTVDEVDTADLAVGALTADMLLANDAFIDALSAADLTAVTIIGTTIKTSSQESRGIVIDEAFTVYNAVGDLFLIADPAADEMFVSGTGKFRTVTSSDGASLGGETEIPTGGKAVLRAATAAPKGAPAVAPYYTTTQFYDDGLWAGRRGWATDGTYWYTTAIRSAPNGEFCAVERWLPGQSSPTRFYGDFSLAPRLPVGVAVLDGYIVGAFDLRGTDDGKNARDIWYVWAPLNNLGDVRQARRVQYLVAESSPVAIGSDGTYIYNAFNATATDGTPFVGAVTFNANKTNFESSVANFLDPARDLGGTPAGVVRTSVDLPGNRYFLAPLGTGGFQAFTRQSNNAVGVDQLADDFPAAAAKIGFCHDGTRFHQMGSDGVMRSYTNLAGGDTYVSSTFARGGSASAAPTYETSQSPRSKLTIPKRGGLQVTASAVPPGEGGAVPDRVRIYTAPAASGGVDPGRTAMRLQSAPASGIVTARLTTLATTGANPPAASSFPGGNPGEWSADLGGFRVDGNSNGSVGTAGLRDSVVAAARADFLAYAAGFRSPNATQSVPRNTPVAVNLSGTPSHSSARMTLTSGTIVTVLDAGLYTVHGAVKFSSSGSGSSGGRVMNIEMFTNEGTAVGGGTYIVEEGLAEQSSGSTPLSGLTDIYLPAGTKLRLWVQQNAAANTNAMVLNRICQLNIKRVG